MELTILMPCLNEAETLGRCIDKARAFLERAGVDGEVLVADNGSSDGSPAIAAARGARVVPVAERGYGAALRGGIAAARGRYVIMGDADDSYDFSRAGRFRGRAARRARTSSWATASAAASGRGPCPCCTSCLGNPVLSFIGRLFFKIPVHDFHCGLRGFRTDAIRALELRTTGMEFASEMVVRAALERLRVVEVPTTLAPDGRSRPPHLRTWRDGWRHLKFLLIFCPRWLFLYPGVVFLSAGLAVVALLFAGPVWVGGVGFETKTFMAGCLCLLVGVQSLTFALMVRRYASRQGFLPRHSALRGPSRPGDAGTTGPRRAAAVRGRVRRHRLVFHRLVERVLRPVRQPAGHPPDGPEHHPARRGGAGVSDRLPGRGHGGRRRFPVTVTSCGRTPG